MNFVRTIVVAAALLVMGVYCQAQTYTQPKPAPCRSNGRNVPGNIAAFLCGVPMGNQAVVQWQINNDQFEIFGTAWSLSDLNSSTEQTEFAQPSGSTPGTFAFTWAGVGTDGLEHKGTISGTWTVAFNRFGWCYPTIQTSTLTVIE